MLKPVDERVFFLLKKSPLEGSCTERWVGCFSTTSLGDTGVGGVLDLVVDGEFVADPRLNDMRRCSFPSIGSDPFTTGSGFVNGARFAVADSEFDFRPKRSDIAR